LPSFNSGFAIFPILFVQIKQNTLMPIENKKKGISGFLDAKE
jgi:hypothetical protein